MTEPLSSNLSLIVQFLSNCNQFEQHRNPAIATTSTNASPPTQTYPQILKRFHRLEDTFRKITDSTQYSLIQDFPSDYYENEKSHSRKVRIVYPHKNANLDEVRGYLDVTPEYKYQVTMKRLNFEKFLKERLERTVLDVKKGIRAAMQNNQNDASRRPGMSKRLKQMRDFMEEGNAAQHTDSLPPPPKMTPGAQFVAYRHTTVDSLKRSNPLLQQQNHLKNASKLQQKKVPLVQTCGIAPSLDPSIVLRKKKGVYKDLAESMMRAQKYAEEFQKKSAVGQAQHVQQKANSTPPPQAGATPPPSVVGAHSAAPGSIPQAASMLAANAKMGTLPPGTLGGSTSHINRNLSPYNAMMANGVHLAGMVAKGPSSGAAANNFSLQPPPPPGVNISQQGPQLPGGVPGAAVPGAHKRKASSQLNSNSLKKRRTGSIQSLSVNTKNPATLGSSFPSNLRIESNSTRLISGGLNSPGITPNSLKNLPKEVQQNILQMRGIKHQLQGGDNGGNK